MKSLFTLLVAPLMVLSLAVAGFAGTQSATTGSQTTATEKKMEPMEKAMTFTGKVTAVNEADKTIVVKGKEAEKTFDVSSVTIGGAVKPGQTVHVTYTEKEGKMIASSVSGMKTSMKHESHKAKKAA
jgi:hypothetical protein